MKPLIGITPLWDDKMQNIWMLPDYIDSIRKTGGSPVVLTLTDDEDEIESACSKCDGILFAGGEDIDPKHYGEEPVPELGPICAARDTFELKLFKAARSMNKPMLGICKGMQLINVAMGGTLYQDIITQHPSDTKHSMTPPYHAVAHYVDVVIGSQMDELFNASSSPSYNRNNSSIGNSIDCQNTADVHNIINNHEPVQINKLVITGDYQDGKLGVNSRHHQAVKDLADALETMAVSEDGLIEAYRSAKDRFIWGVQWHPEHMYDVSEESRRIFRLFIEEAAMSEKNNA